MALASNSGAFPTTKQEVDGGTSTSFPLPGGGQSVSGPTLVIIQCFVRSSNPILTGPAGWSSFVSNIDILDAQYLLYRFYPANSTIDSSIIIGFPAGISVADLEGIAYPGVSGLDAGPLETHSTNISTVVTAPAITTATDGDNIVWFYSGIGVVGGVSLVSAGSIESQFDNFTAPRSYAGCQAIADLTQAAHGIESGQSMTCSSAEWLNSGIVVALAPALPPSPTQSATPTPTRTPAPTPTALPVSVFGATTRQEIDGGTSTILPLPHGGQTVSGATLVMIQCFVRAGVPTVAAPGGWSSFVSSIDNVDAQYLIYKLYPANSTIDASVTLNFESGGISFAEIEAIAYQGVSGFNAGPLEIHSGSSSPVVTAPPITTAASGDRIVWLYSGIGSPGAVSSVSAGTIESQLDNDTAPRNTSGCQVIADLTQATNGTEPAQSMVCSSNEGLNSGIVVALAPTSAVGVTTSSTPTATPAPTFTPTPKSTATASVTALPTSSVASATPGSTPTPGSAGNGSYPLEGSISCTATGYFHLQQVGDRWWFCAPDGKVDFTRAPALTTDGSSGSAGHGFRHYDKVCLIPKGSSVCQDVTNAAWDSNGGIGDVIMSGSSPAYSLQNSGDAVVVGSSAFAPEFMQFQSGTMGVGGTVSWYFYSSAAGDCGGAPPCWAPLNGNGKPAAVDTPNGSGSYYFDVSGNVGTVDRPVLSNGFIGNASPSSGVDRMELWNPNQSCPATGTSCVWPAGFTAQTLAGVSGIGDSTARYWIKGVVGTAFSTPPLIAQIYESQQTGDMLAAKYGGQYYTLYLKWFNNDIPKLVSYGINATGQASDRYWGMLLGGASGDGGIMLAPNATVPVELSWNISDLVMRSANYFSPSLVTNGSPIKNMMSNVYSTFCGGYEGRTPDAFDPQYTAALTNSVKFFTGQGSWAGNGGSLPDASKVYAILTEEADDLFLIGARYHEHLGALVLMANPYLAQDAQGGVTYSDPVLYSKTLGLRDFLANEYGCSGSADPANSNYCGATAAATALAALNRAWGTSYTTWNTSSGSISNGTNAYGTGSGLLDENGADVISSCHFVDYNHSGWTTNTTIRTDLDAFVSRWSQVYAQSMRTALTAVLTTAAIKPPIFTPLYTGPDQAYQAIAPYTDGFWTNPGESADGNTYSFDPVQSASDLARIAADANKPIIVGDYATASGDIQGAIHCTIGALTYNASTGATTITANNCPYVLPVAVTLDFPDAANPNGCPSSYAKPTSVGWRQSAGTQFVLAGNFTSCLAPGNHLQSVCGPPGNCPNDFPTWAAAAAAEAARFNAMVNLSNSANLKPVVGMEWWDLLPEDLISSAGGAGYGFLTYDDNLFDGATDVAASGKDGNGYPLGGEEPNTPAANRLSGANGLGTYLMQIYSYLQ